MIYPEKDFLKENLKELPYFRALLRAIESRFYQNLDYVAPILDLGTGDGHFAKSTFMQNIDFGIDPNLIMLNEAKKVYSYDLLVNATGAKIPCPDNYFQTVFSNSVLEHIPDIDSVLNEVFRVTRPTAFFYFSVPNQKFTENLSISRLLDARKIKRLAKIYRQFFNQISHHYHCLSLGEWRSKLSQTGFKIIDHWDYFSPYALSILEWGHYLGFPYWISKKIFGRWVLFTRINQTFVYERIKRAYLENPKHVEGSYTFYICQKDI